MIRQRLSLGKDDLVVEIASNDGYMLNNFVLAGIPCVGIEPTESTASASERLGITVIREFFGDTISEKLAADGMQADLIIGNNVLAHIPDINDFACGLGKLLKPNGTITMEFAYLLALVRGCQFDTVYHEHFSYLSLHAVDSIFSKVGLKIYDVEELPTHGGSLRVYGCHKGAFIEPSIRVKDQLRKEKDAGLLGIRIYSDFQKQAERIRGELIEFLSENRKQKTTVAGYGAAAKGNTLLNFSGIKADLLPYVCDAAPSKQNKYLPGSHIPIYSPDYLKIKKPDYILILPWNLSKEVRAELSFARDWGGRFVTAIPELTIL